MARSFLRAEPFTTTLDDVTRALGTVQIGLSASEYAIHAAVSAALTAAGIRHDHEVVLGPRCRIDFLCAGGIGIEIKRGKPNSAAVTRQVERYCRLPGIVGLVLVVERNVFHVPAECCGVPVAYMALTRNWGIAL